MYKLFLFCFVLSLTCKSTVFAKSRHSRSVVSSADGNDGWDRWSEWCQCSVTCGHGVEKRTRHCRQSGCVGASEETRSCHAGPCPEWRDWSSWTTCSVTCGEGVSRRSRMCSTYIGCVGERSQQQSCQQPDCAQWLPWSSWGACDKFCGTGTRTRTRQCTTYGGCVGDASETEECAKTPCCTQWTHWGPCSQTCGQQGVDGTETRTRRCMVEGPGPMGYASEKQSDTRVCTAPMSLCAQWTAWEAWASCTVTCGGGERSRMRDCAGDGTCDGISSDKKRCHDEPCPGWNTWGAWTVCSTSCGGGTRQRQRVCEIEGECGADATESKPCSTYPCPQWTAWGPWSHCSASCGGGWQRRSRVCNQYNFCPGDNFEKRLCNEHLCPQIGEWLDWGVCSEDCGGGVRVRSRPCLTDVDYCQLEENREKTSCHCEEELEEGGVCNQHPCAYWSDWEDWKECTAQCGGGQRSRERRCVMDSEFCVDNNLMSTSCHCDGAVQDPGVCNNFACPEWAQWDHWGECSASCGGGARQRNRRCVVDELHCPASVLESDDPTSIPDTCKCPGLDHMNDMCNSHLCPTWGHWGRWSKCSKPCGGGVKRKERTCLVDDAYCMTTELDGDESCHCEGESEETTDCHTHFCARPSDWTEWSDCDAPCGGGTQTRSRQCERDQTRCFGAKLTTDLSCQCEGMAAGEDQVTESRDCNQYFCAHVEAWSEWQQCSVSCGGGLRFRRRACNSDQSHCADAGNANDPTCTCNEALESEEQCATQSCPTWNEWGEWSTCSVTCAVGVKDRKRTCSTDDDYCADAKILSSECQCDGSDVDAEQCDAGPCHQWSAWMPWSDCSVVCGGGSRNRARTCAVEGGCPGLAEEEDICNQLPCPEWGDWGPYSSCSVSCGGGQQVRTRACPLEGGCSPGEAYDVQECGMDPCPIWAQWGSWGSCSATCGTGQRIRTRGCTGDGECLGRSEEEEPCSTAACELAVHWSEWSPCTQTCGGGVRTRSRAKCIAPGCPTESKTSPCNEHTCPTWSEWGAWTECDVTCGGGSRTHRRQCVDEEEQEWQNGCVGKAVEIDPQACNDFGCSTWFFF